MSKQVALEFISKVENHPFVQEEEMIQEDLETVAGGIVPKYVERNGTIVALPCTEPILFGDKPILKLPTI